VIEERYLVRDLWTNGSWSYVPRAITQYLQKPSTIVRTMPLAFDYPLDVTQRIVFHLPSTIELQAGHDETITRVFRIDSDVKQEGTTITIEHRLRSLADAVPAAAVPRHLTQIGELVDAMGYDLTLAPPRKALASAMPGVGAAAVFVVLAAAVIASRRRRRRT
jgi:hypothetical protein